MDDSKYHVINLSISDLVLGVSLIALVNVRSIKSDIILKYVFAISGGGQNASLYMSSMCVLSLSFERWIAVTFPLLYKVHFTTTKAYGLVVGTWIYGITVGGVLPIYYVWQLPDEAFRLVKSIYSTFFFMAKSSPRF